MRRKQKEPQDAPVISSPSHSINIISAANIVQSSHPSCALLICRATKRRKTASTLNAVNTEPVTRIAGAWLLSTAVILCWSHVNSYVKICFLMLLATIRNHAIMRVWASSITHVQGIVAVITKKTKIPSHG